MDSIDNIIQDKNGKLNVENQIHIKIQIWVTPFGLPNLFSFFESIHFLIYFHFI